jgi:HK97 family phage prohead protease
MTKQYTAFPFHYDMKSISEDGSFEGYGSLFDEEEDEYGDIIAKGAFAKTLLKGGRNKNGVAMLFQHSADKPIGVWTDLKEDDIGLRVKGQLAIKTTMGSDCYELMKMGAIKGLSIGYRSVVEEYNKETNCRILKEIDLWEISPVTFPAKITATITSIQAIEEAKTERDLENALRESGLSKSASQFIVKLCRLGMRESLPKVESNQDLKSILDCLKNANQSYFIK